MSQIHPLTGALIPGNQVQPRHVDDRARHLRRAQNLQRNTALQGDRLDHQVESSEALEHVHEDDANDPRKRRKRPAHRPMDTGDPTASDDGAHIDLTA